MELKLSKNNLKTAPKFFRSGIARGLAKGSKVQADGGKFGAGLVSGFSVIARGEALGHNLWIDQDFVSSVAQALSSEGDSGVKSRFTHPDLSGDGLAKGLGRVVLAESNSSDIVRGDLHIWQSARKSPDGDLGGYILSRAAEDPESFGASIHYEPDLEAEAEFFVEHGGKIVETFEAQIWDASEFKSPDPKNKNNYPHARLAELRAVDTVDDPAANPSGLFHRDETFKEAEGLIEYALGFSDRKPELVSLDIDPDRVGGFVRRFLSSRGLEVMKLKGLNDVDPKAEGDDPTPATPAAPAAPAASASEATPAAPAVAPAPTEPEKPKTPTPEEELSAGRKEAKRFIDSFGAEKGGKWFADGKTFAEASGLFTKDLAEENAKLKKQLAAAQSCEKNPLTTGGGDDKPARTGSGFASKIRLPEPSRN